MGGPGAGRSADRDRIRRRDGRERQRHHLRRGRGEKDPDVAGPDLHAVLPDQGLLRRHRGDAGRGGEIPLDDPVSKYLPEFSTLYVARKGKDGKVVRVPAKNVLTIRMVMNHTGGLVTDIPSKNRGGWPEIPLRDAAMLHDPAETG